MTSKPVSFQKRAFFAAFLVLGTVWLAGCTTTHEVRPTASVMVGAHKSL
ncbi:MULTISPECIES: hypothetical protein [unclassified Psychrobacter]|nr:MULTISPECIES: hypothetical protein [unclassified Psychrobacter]